MLFWGPWANTDQTTCCNELGPEGGLDLPQRVGLAAECIEQKLEIADAVVKKMEIAQLAAHLHRSEVGERRFFVPRAGPFADMADARLAAEKLSRDDVDVRVMRLYDE